MTHDSDRGYPGLIDPAVSRAACGVGLIADLSGRRSHQTVSDGLTILENLAHRGAKNADPLTGDGSGILLPIADEFFRPIARATGIALPSQGNYAIGSVFLPPNPDEADGCRRLVEEVARGRGQAVLGWRDVPIRPGQIGRQGRERMPLIQQVFLDVGDSARRSEQVTERRLFITRKLIEHRPLDWGLPFPTHFSFARSRL